MNAPSGGATGWDENMAVTELAEKSKMSDAERETRCNLAALYRIVDRLKWTDLVYTHLSARVPGEDNCFLINRYGEMFDEVTASSLVKLDLDGNVVGADGKFNFAGFTIHSGCYMARPDVNCAAHLHTAASIAVASQKDGLLPLSQHSLYVISDVAYHDYEGPAVDLDERESLGRDIKEANCILLRNHGSLALGRTIPEAFRNMYYMEVSCQIQIAAQSTGAELIMMPDEIVEVTGERKMERFREGDAGQLEWDAMIRKLDREGSDFRT